MNKQCAQTPSTVWFSHAFPITASLPLLHRLTFFALPLNYLFKTTTKKSNPFPRSLTAISRQTGLFEGSRTPSACITPPHARRCPLCPTHGCTPHTSKPPCTSKPPRASKHHTPPNPTCLQTPRAIETPRASVHLLYHQSHIHSPIMCCISVCLYS